LISQLNSIIHTYFPCAIEFMLLWTGFSRSSFFSCGVAAIKSWSSKIGNTCSVSKLLSLWKYGLLSLDWKWLICWLIK
jgi:hypothetical protein